MAESGSWVKLDRNIMKWGWYTDGNTMRVFLHLILSANIKSHEFKGVTIRRGEVATSYGSIGRALHMNYAPVRTAIDHLKSTGEITITRYSKFLVISIENYDKYQTRNASKNTIKTQSLDNQNAITSQQSKNVKKEKNEKNITRARARDAEWEERLNVPERLRGRFEDEHEYLVFRGEADPNEI